MKQKCGIFSDNHGVDSHLFADEEVLATIIAVYRKSQWEICRKWFKYFQNEAIQLVHLDPSERKLTARADEMLECPATVWAT